MPGDTIAEERTAVEAEPIVTEFKTGDESEFQKPDHDPHGEMFASAAHCTTSCDNPDCDTVGLVAEGTLEHASEFSPGPERDVVCSEECAQ